MKDKKMNRYDIDVDSLTKGDVIPCSQVETCLKAKFGTQKFSLGVLSVREWIDRRLRRRGLVAGIRISHGNIEILRDIDASDYKHTLQMNRFRGCRRDQDVLQSVDTAEFTDTQKADPACDNPGFVACYGTGHDAMCFRVDIDRHATSLAVVKEFVQEAQRALVHRKYVIAAEALAIAMDEIAAREDKLCEQKG